MWKWFTYIIKRLQHLSHLQDDAYLRVPSTRYYILVLKCHYILLRLIYSTEHTYVRSTYLCNYKLHTKYVDKSEIYILRVGFHYTLLICIRMCFVHLGHDAFSASPRHETRAHISVSDNAISKQAKNHIYVQNALSILKPHEYVRASQAKVASA